MKNNKITKMLLQTIIIFSIVLLPANMVYAKENTIQVDLPVKQNFVITAETGESVNLTGTYQLSAAEDSFPMPEDAIGGRYIFPIQGIDNQAVLSFNYADTGIYRYSIRQITEDSENYEYDRAVYNITVYIENQESGILSAQVIAENSDGEKCGEISFRNTYKVPSENSTPDKPIDTPDTPDNTPNPSDKNPSETAQTGDTSHIYLWLLLGAVSIIGLGTLSCLLLKKKSK